MIRSEQKLSYYDNLLDCNVKKGGDRLSVGSQLKKYRKKKGYTQIDVAILIQKATSTVSKYEKEKIEPPFKILSLLADIYECEVSDFFNSNFDDTENN